jgi:hypothetical protein
MLTIPLMSSKKDVLGILQIINAQDQDKRIRAFSQTDEKVMLHFAGIAAVALERAQMTRSMILRMIRMAEMRDPKETGAHVNRVAGFSLEIYEHWAKRRSIDQKEIDKTRDVLRMGAMLHDVGKVAISDLILKKPAQLSFEEFEIMKQHTIHGARLFSNLQSDYDEAAAIIAMNHHEKWDGTGYPGHVNPNYGRTDARPRKPSMGRCPVKRKRDPHSWAASLPLPTSTMPSVPNEATRSRGTNPGASKSSARAQAPILILNWWKFFWNRLAFIRAIQSAYIRNACRAARKIRRLDTPKC